LAIGRERMKKVRCITIVSLFILVIDLSACGGGSGGNSTSTALPNLGINANLNGKILFPADNPWNTPIDKEPVDPMSDNIIAALSPHTLHPDFGGPYGIPYIVIDGSVNKRPVTFSVPDESDVGPYPIPADAPVENGSDRHVIILDRDNWKLYELFHAFINNGGNDNAYSGAIFDLNSNTLRPEGWTSADAAGLPIFPGLVRYEEVVERKLISHALRFTLERSRTKYIHPATHQAGWSSYIYWPPMGARFRLKANYDTSGFSESSRVILTALKKYGMFLADNGGSYFISGAVDARWNVTELDELKSVPSSAFEIVLMGRLYP